MFWVISNIHLDLSSVQIIPVIQNTIKQNLFDIYVEFRSIGFTFI